MLPSAAVFLDRDGVIIEDVGYLAETAQLKLIPGAAAAIRRLNASGLLVVVTSNQAGVARGYFPESRIAEVHGALDDLLAVEGARIDRYYYCPHHPLGSVAGYCTVCDCRKPRPGMLLRAARELNIALDQSILIGDKLSDLEAGASVECSTILVRTGYGSGARELGKTFAEPIHIAADLPAAVDHLLSRLAAHEPLNRLTS